MNSNPAPSDKATAGNPAEVLQQLSRIFADKGWLNQSVRIKYGDKRYRIFCDGNDFVAYRINDRWGDSPGTPGWPVCIVKQDQIIENSQMSSQAPAEPSARDWLNCLISGNIEVI